MRLLEHGSIKTLMGGTVIDLVRTLIEAGGYHLKITKIMVSMGKRRAVPASLGPIYPGGKLHSEQEKCT
jgi:hypothetical protein